MLQGRKNGNRPFSLFFTICLKIRKSRGLHRYLRSSIFHNILPWPWQALLSFAILVLSVLPYYFTSFYLLISSLYLPNLYPSLLSLPFPYAILFCSSFPNLCTTSNSSTREREVNTRETFAASVVAAKASTNILHMSKFYLRFSSFKTVNTMQLGARPSSCWLITFSSFCSTVNTKIYS